MKVLGIVGSYRKGGVIDSLVSAALDGAREGGAETEKIYLADQRIEFCRNCRKCTQAPGTEPGTCVIDDDMAAILSRYRESAAIVIGAPVNYFNVNALTRQFMERLICFGYWPWGQGGPRLRSKRKDKKAILITSSAMPAFLGSLFTGAMRALRLAAQTMGAKPVATIFAGLIAQQESPVVPDRLIRRARAAGLRLAAH